MKGHEAVYETLEWLLQRSLFHPDDVERRRTVSGLNIAIAPYIISRVYNGDNQVMLEVRCPDGTHPTLVVGDVPKGYRGMPVHQFVADEHVR